MKVSTRLEIWALSLIIAAPIAMTPSVAFSQGAGSDEVIEEVVTTGTRREGQSPLRLYRQLMC